MFTKRHINIPNNEHFVKTNCLKAEQIAQFAEVSTLLDHTQTQVEEILAQARQEADVILQQTQVQAEELIAEKMQQAEADVWQKANQLLTSLSNEQARIRAQIEHHATQVLMQAMQRLLGELSDHQRASVLVRQLCEVQQSDNQKGVLRCHPEQKSTLIKVLASMEQSLWQVQADLNMAPNAVLLESAGGYFSCSLAAITNQLCQLEDNQSVELDDDEADDLNDDDLAMGLVIQETASRAAHHP